MISVFRRRFVVGRTLTLRRAFRRPLRPSWRALPSCLQDTNERAKAGEQRYYQDIENESLHRFATAKSKDIETAKASIRVYISRTAISAGTC
jgi:hypothetical protein